MPSPNDNLPTSDIVDDNVIDVCDERLLANVPLVSVHMLAYRHGRFLAQAIDGVLAQECGFAFELIIAEDCSPDDTLEIALTYQRRNPAVIRVIHGKRNVGMHENANRSAPFCRGQYIAVCEGDDYWCDPTKLARQMAIFRTHPECTLVYHAAGYIDSETGRQTRTSRQSFFSRMLSTEEVILGDGGLIPTASIMMRNELVQSLPVWYHQAPVGDYPLALWAALRGRIAYLDRIMSVYRTNVPHSWTQRYVPDMAARMRYAQQIEAMFAGFSAETENRFDAATREMISKYYSDPIVRLPGPREDRRRFYDEVATKLHGSDRWLAWLAVKAGLRLPLLKDLFRKSRSLRRLIQSHLLGERIRTDPHVATGAPTNSEKHSAR